MPLPPTLYTESEVPVVAALEDIDPLYFAADVGVFEVPNGVAPSLSQSSMEEFEGGSVESAATMSSMSSQWTEPGGDWEGYAAEMQMRRGDEATRIARWWRAKRYLALRRASLARPLVASVDEVIKEKPTMQSGAGSVEHIVCQHGVLDKSVLSSFAAVAQQANCTLITGAGLASAISAVLPHGCPHLRRQRELRESNGRVWYRVGQYMPASGELLHNRAFAAAVAESVQLERALTDAQLATLGADIPAFRTQHVVMHNGVHYQPRGRTRESVQDQPGTVSVHHDNMALKPSVINLYAQMGGGTAQPKGQWGETAEKRIQWFRDSLAALTARRLRLASIAFPWRIGCGLAGGCWDAYRAAIVEFAHANPAVRVAIVQRTCDVADDAKEQVDVAHVELDTATRKAQAFAARVSAHAPLFGAVLGALSQGVSTIAAMGGLSGAKVQRTAARKNPRRVPLSNSAVQRLRATFNAVWAVCRLRAAAVRREAWRGVQCDILRHAAWQCSPQHPQRRAAQRSYSRAIVRTSHGMPAAKLRPLPAEPAVSEFPVASADQERALHAGGFVRCGADWRQYGAAPEADVMERAHAARAAVHELREAWYREAVAHAGPECSQCRSVPDRRELGALVACIARIQWQSEVHRVHQHNAGVEADMRYRAMLTQAYFDGSLEGTVTSMLSPRRVACSAVSAANSLPTPATRMPAVAEVCMASSADATAALIAKAVPICVSSAEYVVQADSGMWLDVAIPTALLSRVQDGTYCVAVRALYDDRLRPSVLEVEEHVYHVKPDGTMRIRVKNQRRKQTRVRRGTPLASFDLVSVAEMERLTREWQQADATPVAIAEEEPADDSRAQQLCDTDVAPPAPREAVRTVAFAGQSIEIAPFQVAEVRVRLPASIKADHPVAIVPLERERMPSALSEVHLVPQSGVADSDGFVRAQLFNASSRVQSVPEMSPLGRFVADPSVGEHAFEFTIEEIMERVHLPPNPTAAEVELIKQMLMTRRRIFATKLGWAHSFRPTIDTPQVDSGEIPAPSLPERRRPPMEYAALKAVVEKQLKEGLIEPARSAFNAQPVMVPKADSTPDKPSWRLCLDFRSLNLVTVKCSYPLPNVENNLSLLGEADIFTCLDLLQGYFQAEIHPDSRHKTSFSTPLGQMQYVRMPMGLTSSPGFFMCMVDTALQGLPPGAAVAYMDDVIVPSSGGDDHLVRLGVHMKDVGIVFDRLIESGFTVRCDKMHIALEEVPYLGFLVSRRGTRPNPQKVQALLDITLALMGTDAKAAGRFSGMVGFYSRYVPYLNIVRAPFFALKEKGAKVHEIMTSLKFNASFKHLRYQLVNLTCLTRPDASKSYYVFPDGAASCGGGAVLMQRADVADCESLRPIAWQSRRYSKEERGYPPRDLECLALVDAVKEWRPYLLGAHVVVHSDHSSLRWLLTTRHTPGSRVQNWALYLAPFDLDIQYVPGITHVVPDCLSRSRGDVRDVSVAWLLSEDCATQNVTAMEPETLSNLNGALLAHVEAPSIERLFAERRRDVTGVSAVWSEVYTARSQHAKVIVRACTRAAVLAVCERAGELYVLVERVGELTALPSVPVEAGATPYRRQLCKHLEGIYEDGTRELACDTLMLNAASHRPYWGRTANTTHYFSMVLACGGNFAGAGVEGREFVTLNGETPYRLHSDEDMYVAAAFVHAARGRGTTATWADMHFRHTLFRLRVSDCSATFVDTSAAASQACLQLHDSLEGNRVEKGEAVLAVDLEGALGTVWNHIALLQAHCDGGDTVAAQTVVFDPHVCPQILHDTHEHSLRSMLGSVEVIKVLHSCHGDTAALFCEYGITCERVFDTAIADSLLNHKHPGSSRGLGVVIAAWLGEAVAATMELKGKLIFTPGMFEKRPLPEHLYVYSYEDVLHCGRLYEVMRKALVARGLLELAFTLSQGRCPPLSLPPGHARAIRPQRAAIALVDRDYVICLRGVDEQCSLPVGQICETDGRPRSYTREAQRIWRDIMGKPPRHAAQAIGAHMRKPIRLGEALLFVAHMQDVTASAAALSAALPPATRMWARICVRPRVDYESPACECPVGMRVYFQMLHVEAERAVARVPASVRRNTTECNVVVGTTKVKNARGALILYDERDGERCALVVCGRTVREPFRFPSAPLEVDNTPQAAAVAGFDQHLGSVRRGAEGAPSPYQIAPKATRRFAAACEQLSGVGAQGNTQFFASHAPLFEHTSALAAFRMSVNGYRATYVFSQAHCDTVIAAPWSALTLTTYYTAVFDPSPRARILWRYVGTSLPSEKLTRHAVITSMLHCHVPAVYDTHGACVYGRPCVHVIEPHEWQKLPATPPLVGGCTVAVPPRLNAHDLCAAQTLERLFEPKIECGVVVRPCTGAHCTEAFITEPIFVRPAQEKRKSTPCRLVGLQLVGTNANIEIDVDANIGDTGSGTVILGASFVARCRRQDPQCFTVVAPGEDAVMAVRGIGGAISCALEHLSFVVLFGGVMCTFVDMPVIEGFNGFLIGNEAHMQMGASYTYVPFTLTGVRYDGSMCVRGGQPVPFVCTRAGAAYTPITLSATHVADSCLSPSRCDVRDLGSEGAVYVADATREQEVPPGEMPRVGVDPDLDALFEARVAYKFAQFLVGAGKAAEAFPAEPVSSGSKPSRPLLPGGNEVDAVGAPPKFGTPTRSDLLQAQWAHEVTRSYLTYLDSGEMPEAVGTMPGAEQQRFRALAEKHYVAFDGVLMRRGAVPGEGRAVIPPSLRDDVMVAMHDRQGHPGVQRMMPLVLHRYYWGNRSSMKQDVAQYVRLCRVCAHKVPHVLGGEGHLVENGTHPYHILSGDHFKTGVRDGEYDGTVNFICDFTRNVTCCPVAGSPNSETICWLLINFVIRYYGTPRVVRSDNATVFTSAALQYLYERFGIKLRHSTSYAHRTIGVIERFHSVLKSLLLTNRIATNMDGWVEYLPFLELAFNTTTNSALGATPFYLNHGRQALLPAEVFASHPEFTGEVMEWWQQQLSRLRVSWDVNAKVLRRNAIASKRKFDLKHDVTASLKPGQQCLLIKGQFLDHTLPKGEDPVDGPFTVDQVLDQGRYRLRDMHTRRIHEIVGIERLLPFPTRERGVSGDGGVQRYPIQAVMAHRTRVLKQAIKELGLEAGDSILEYRVRWSGYGREEDRWIPARYLLPISEVIAAYNQRVIDSGGTPPRDPLPLEPSVDEAPQPPPRPEAVHRRRFRRHIEHDGEEAEPPTEAHEEHTEPPEPAAAPVPEPDAQTWAREFPVGTSVEVQLRDSNAWMRGTVLHVNITRPRTRPPKCHFFIRIGSSKRISCIAGEDSIRHAQDS